MYADYSYYTAEYFGDILTSDNASKYLKRASSELDGRTFSRLQTAFPVDTYAQTRVKDAVCAVAETLCQIDNLLTATSAKVQSDGSYQAPISSISSGSESISYSSSVSPYSKAAQSQTEKNSLITAIINSYLAYVPDSTGVNLLYAGAEGNHVR